VVQTLRGAQAGRPGADDEDINLSAHTVSKPERGQRAAAAPTHISLTLVGATLEVFRLRLMVEMLDGCDEAWERLGLEFWISKAKLQRRRRND
jgi:hypothetical protein